MAKSLKPIKSKFKKLNNIRQLTMTVNTVLCMSYETPICLIGYSFKRKEGEGVSL